jgi:hypothetical protein
MIIVAFILFVIWIAVLYSIGIPNILSSLGGSAGFYFAIPLIIIVAVKFRELAKLIWCVILTLFGLIASNFFYSYLINHSKSINPILLIAIIWFSSLFILSGIALALHYFLDFKNKGYLNRKEKDDSEVLRYFSAFFTAIFHTPLLITIPIILGVGRLKSAPDIGYQIAFGCLILGGTIFLIELIKVPIETLNYYAKPIPRFKADIKKIKKKFEIGILMFLVIFLYLEIKYRGFWIFGIETTILFIIFSILLYKFSTIFFIPFSETNERPVQTDLPSMKKPINIVFVAIISMVFFILLLIL